ncbi:MAG: hypothetical protein AB7E52_05830 [Bdellovibrionales bacterium]
MIHALPTDHPLYQEARARLEERVEDVKRDFPTRSDWPCQTNAPPSDLLFSCLTIHKKEELSLIYDVVAKGGLFLGVLAGNNSLYELRDSLLHAEIALKGGASLRVPPFPHSGDLGKALVATGFALPVVDVETVTLDYPDLPSLMTDLRTRGLTNSHAERSRIFAPRTLFDKAQEIYAERYPSPSGGIAVTVDLVFLHGWKEETHRRR